MHIYVVMCMPWLLYDQRPTLWSWFSPTTFTWVTGVELRLPGFVTTALSAVFLLTKIELTAHSAITEAQMSLSFGLFFLIRNATAFFYLGVHMSITAQCLEPQPF